MQEYIKFCKSARGVIFLLLLAVMLCRCGQKGAGNARIEDVAANEEVAHYMKTFEKKGEHPDGSKPVEPAKTLAMFRHADDVCVDLVVSEPQISQPVFINFDGRGRLWVVQYNQYPYPAGLKVTSIDNHDRVTFDKIPQPPPGGVKGADRITFFEDKDGDGIYEHSTDAITGLNIATSVVTGRGNIWVLSPPYLLAYPDPDGDGLPDGPPVVHLRGFGLEDTHAVANSLRWGPDGWLYGAQGSTTTADVSSSVSKHVRFSGQAIWRYHPGSHEFEIFAEGGGNTFCVEIDKKGRIFSGDNGISRGYYFKQGAYYSKNWGKHGALTNPYAFGYLSGMGLHGDSLRFTHSWIKYEETNLPGRYRGKIIALNPLHGFVQRTGFEPEGSSFNTVDEEHILSTPDRWFRPVDIKPGPDGAVYIADWYDSRLSHVDPLDNWHKSSGRIYRLRSKSGSAVQKPFDLSKYDGRRLIGLLSDSNRWFRQQALVQIADRKDRSMIPVLTTMLLRDTGQTALEALWAINLLGGFNDSIAAMALKHSDPYVRMWAVRLLGDARKASPGLAGLLASLSASEPCPEVRSQLAASAKRFPGTVALPIIRNLLVHHDDSGDPDIPLQLWWALESKAATDRNAVLSLFDDRRIWQRLLVKKVILERIMQRYAMAGQDTDLIACGRLLGKAPDHESAKRLLTGLQEGLLGATLKNMPPALVRALRPYRHELAEQSGGVAIAQGDARALKQALALIADDQAALGKRLQLIRMLTELNRAEEVPVLLRLVEDGHSPDAILDVSLQALQQFDDTTIAARVLAVYPDKLRADQHVRAAALSLFASRIAWARLFLDQTGNGKKIHPDDVPLQIVQRLAALGDPLVTAVTSKLWPDLRFSAADQKREKMAYVARLLKTGGGSIGNGKIVFSGLCGSCHRLFGEGGQIGPELTGYDRSNLTDLLTNIIDPNAYIREGYEHYLIITKDGRNIMGRIEERRGKLLRIRPLYGETILLDSASVKSIAVQANSIMPEGLLNSLTDQQLRDLFTFLTSRPVR